MQRHGWKSRLHDEEKNPTEKSGHLSGSSKKEVPRLSVQEMIKGNTSGKMGRGPGEAGNRQPMMHICPLWRREGMKEGRQGGILVRWKPLRPPCSSKEAQQNWWGVLEPEVPVSGAAYLPGTACTHVPATRSQGLEQPVGSVSSHGRGDDGLRSPAESAVGQSPQSEIREMYFHDHNIEQFHRWRSRAGKKINVQW